jgi:chitinase
MALTLAFEFDNRGYLANCASLSLVLAMVFGISANVLSHVSHVARPKYRIVAYVFGPLDISAISAQKLTHINFAFAHVSKEGEIIFENPDAASRLSQLQALKARNSALKIIVSVGGWGADNFSDAALTDLSREKFAASAVDLVKRYTLDGIDLDWEYPGQAGPGIKYRLEDKENFTLMLKAVRRHLDVLSDERKRKGNERYTLSIASAAGEYFKHTEMDKLHVYLDWINIMTYDFYTSESKTTGHHTSLYRSLSAGDSAGFADASVNQHLSTGIPPGKLVLGVAFYGRGFTGVNPENNGRYQPFQKYAGGFPYGTLSRDYVNKQGFTRFWDDAAKAPYLWNATTSTFITYDDPESLKAKADFVKLRHLGGIMYWEHSNDPTEQLLDVIFNRFR